jgi:ubiquinone/menaquinone biosynthesis C-methylase UbiE
MLTASQLERLLQILNLDMHHRVLDLGCGIGTITEHISDVTQATVTGADFAVAAIEYARERTKRKRGRLTFEVGDMDDLPFPIDSFDAIISVDTLYFVEDRTKTMCRLKEILAPGGQMGLFWTQTAKPTEPQELLQPTKTELAQVLDEAGLRYEFWDYTEEERDLWKRSLALTNELKPSFEAEGNVELADGQICESQEMVAHVEAGRIARYLYHVRDT